MRPKSGGKERGNFHTGGLKGIDALKRLHKDISKFAMERINEIGHEDWPRIDEPSGSLETCFTNSIPTIVGILFRLTQYLRSSVRHQVHSAVQIDSKSDEF